MTCCEIVSYLENFRDLIDREVIDCSNEFYDLHYDAFEMNSKLIEINFEQCKRNHPETIKIEPIPDCIRLFDYSRKSE